MNTTTRDIQILKEAGFVQQFSALRNNLCRIVLALAIVEIVDKSLFDNNPSPILYRLVWRVLDKLNDENQNSWFVFAFFLYQLLLQLGFMPDLKNCSKCRQELVHGGIDNCSGELVCPDCVDQYQMNAGEIGFIFLKQLTSLHLDDLNTISLPNNDIIDSIHLLESFMLFHIEGFNKVRSIDIMRKLLNQSINL